MSFFRQYPDNIAVIICNGTPHVIDLGAPTPLDNEQLEMIGVQVFKIGLQPTVKLRVNAYVDGDLIQSTNWIDMSVIEGLYPETDNFYGWLRFEFSPRLNFRSDGPTRFELELNNYSFSETGWIAAVYDWPVQMGYNADPDQIQDAPVALELLGARPVI